MTAEQQQGVFAAIPFEVTAADPLGTTPPPTDAELAILRTEVDPNRYILGRAG